MLNTLVPDRELTATRFSAASADYDNHALHHRLIAHRVSKIIYEFNPDNLLELGSGTGILSELLNRNFPGAQKTFTDIAPEMVRMCRKKLPESDLISHSVSSLEEPDNSRSFDLVVSSCAVQWSTDNLLFVKNQAAVVRPGGFAVHAIPVVGMLEELVESFRKTGGRMNQLNYLSGTDWNNYFANAGFRDGGSFSMDFTVRYRSPAEAVRAVRAIGALLDGHPGAIPVAPSALRRALEFYRTEYGDESGAVPATYKIHFLIAERAPV